MQLSLVTATRRPAAAAALAGIALLTAACSGSRPAGPGASTQPSFAQALGRYAHCMRAHGESGTYIARAPASPAPGVTLLIFHGFAVNGVSTSSPQFGPAMKACQHLLPHGTPPDPAQQHQAFVQALKTARCMRAHGYPDWPDPQAGPGYNFQALPPSSIDTSSPQFEAAARACGVSLPPG
jgi:hypothetical protein